LISNLLVQERNRIVARVAATGTLVLAGILRTEFEPVCKSFEERDMRLVRRRDEKEWSSGAFVFAARRAR
jgi:ribosomal protein L11 methylase PrmA